MEIILRERRWSAFTLTEILVVLGVIALLAAMLFPAFALVREKGRSANCTSNLHQLGAAVQLYAQDNSELFPLGADPLDLHSSIWRDAEGGKYWARVSVMPPIQTLILPYARSAALFHCPSDTGFDETSMAPGYPLAAHPSSFDAFGTSYYYRTEVALDGLSLDGMVAHETEPISADVGPEAVNLMFDGTDLWHGGRLNVLFADGHVKSQNADQSNANWNLTFPGAG